MAQHRVCPWWLGYILINPLRRLRQDPAKLLAPYVRQGMIVLEPGPGMGFFTIELARRVGPSGRVVALDVQDRMLQRLKRRAARAGLLDRLDARLVPPHSMDLKGMDAAVDFVLAMYVVHELPDARRFFLEAAGAMKPGACLLLAEPKTYVSREEFEAELGAAAQAGFQPLEPPAFAGSHVALLKK